MRHRLLDVTQPEPRPPATPALPGACQSGGCGGAAPPMPPPPSFGEVLVNGIEIEPEAIAREIQHHPAPDPETAWRDAARALAVRELLLQEARRRGIEADPEADEDGRLEAEDDALVRALLEEAVVPDLPGEDECRRYYEARRSRFRTPELFEPAHVLVEPEGNGPDAWAAAEGQVRAIIAAVGDDPAAFAEAARQLSACPSAQQDGSLGQVRRGELLPAMQEALEATEEGTVRREPVRSRYGWHAVRLHRRIPGRELPFEVVCDKIADMLAARAWQLAAMRYVTALAGEAEVEGVAIEPAPDPAGL